VKKRKKQHAKTSHSPPHKQTNTQTVSEQPPWNLNPTRPFSSFTSTVTAEHDLLRYRTSFRPVWVSCPGCVSSQPLAHP